MSAGVWQGLAHILLDVRDQGLVLHEISPQFGKRKGLRRWCARTTACCLLGTLHRAPSAVRLRESVLQGMEYLHSKKIVHFDLKVRHAGVCGSFCWLEHWR